MAFIKGGNNAGVIVLFRISLENKVLECSESYAKIFGYNSAQEVIGLKTDEMYSSGPNFIKLMTEANGKLSALQSLYILKDNSRKRLVQNAQLMCDEDNQPQYYEGSVIDTTYSYEMELRKGLVEVLPAENPNPVIKVDYKLNVVYQNEAANKIESRVAKTGSITAPRLKKFLQEMLTTKLGKATVELRLNKRYYLFTVVNIFEEGYLNLYGTDITELEKTKAEYLRLTKDLESVIVERTDKLNETVQDLNNEIETRRNTESKLQNSLSEKEVLLNEITHRVKNNLQVISSLLNLQKSKINNRESIDLLSDTSHRIKSMALIHETLYKSSDFSQINFNSYINSLIRYINNSFDTKYIQINTDIETVDLTIDTASSCGMIVMELITNSVKYAFPDNRNGIIQIEFRKLDGDNFLLKISDNGVGLTSKVDPTSSDTLGMQLVYGLAGQLAGSVKMESDNGVKVEINFQDTKRHKYER